MHLRINLKFLGEILVHPVRRQNFAGTGAPQILQHLRLCHICSDFNDIQIMRVIYICDQELCEGTGRLVEAAAIQRRNRCETESQARLMDDGGRHQVTFLSSSRKCFLKRIHLTDWEHILAFFNLVIASKSYSTLSSLSKGVASSELGLRSEGA